MGKNRPPKFVTDACNNVFSREPVSMDLRGATTFYSVESGGTVLDVTPSKTAVSQFVAQLRKKGSKPRVYLVVGGKKIRVRWKGET